MTENKNTVSSRVPAAIASILQRQAEDRGITRSEHIKNVLIDNIGDYADLSVVEQQYVSVLQQETKDEMEKKVAQWQMKAATFDNYVQQTVKRLKKNGASDEDLVRILETMRESAKRKNAEDTLDEIIEDVRSGNGPDPLEDNPFADEALAGIGKTKEELEDLVLDGAEV